MYYRNITDIISDQNIEIEAGSLWKLDVETFILTLVDDDQHITAKHAVEVFKFAIYKYKLEISHSMDLSKILMAFGEELISWQLNGDENSDVMRFQFGTLSRFGKVEELIRASGVSRDTLQAMDEDNG